MDASLLDDFSIRLRWFQSGESTIVFSPISGHEYSIAGELRVSPASFSSSFSSFCYANDLFRFRDQLAALLDGSASTAVFESVDFDVQISISVSEGQHVCRVKYQFYADPV